MSWLASLGVDLSRLNAVGVFTLFGAIAGFASLGLNGYWFWTKDGTHVKVSSRAEERGGMLGVAIDVYNSSRRRIRVEQIDLLHSPKLQDRWRWQVSAVEAAVDPPPRRDVSAESTETFWLGMTNLQEYCLSEHGLRLPDLGAKPAKVRVHFGTSDFRTTRAFRLPQ